MFGINAYMCQPSHSFLVIQGFFNTMRMELLDKGATTHYITSHLNIPIIAQALMC